MIDTDFQFSVKVYYEDTDAGGVVYHANYLKFMERARSEYLIQKGCSVVECEKEFGIIFVVRHLEIDYVTPARLGNELTVSTKVIKLGKVGMKMKQDVYNSQGLLICSALVKLAAIHKFSEDSYTLTPISPEIIDKLSSES